MPTSKKWVVKGGRQPLDAKRVEEELGIPPLVTEILARRGLADVTAVRGFLSPDLEALHDPFLLPDMEKAVERLWQAVDRGETILVHGDYDVDGVTGVVLLVRFFRGLGTNVLYSLPDRLLEGYGLSERAVAEARDQRAAVLVTVDCGISDHEHVARAAESGIDTIVTDHHLPGDSLPPALAVVAHSRADARYPSPGPAGVGVAYKLLQAMAQMRPDRCPAIEEDLDLVALGTVADMVPLVGENRILAYHGLKRLTSTAKAGLIALKSVARLRDGSPVRSWQVAFGLAPRLNAAGRLGDARSAVDLLLTEDEEEARSCATGLDEENQRRRELDQRTLEEAIQKVEAEGVGERLVITLGDKDWHSGVIGIVASRLVQRYHRPAVLVAFEEGVGKGSGRSIEEFDLAWALGRCRDLLVSYGGHKRAAGLTVTEDSFEDFRGRLERIAAEAITPEMLQPTLAVDGIVGLEVCDLEMLEWFRSLEPFGEGNPPPVLASLDNQIVGSPRTVGGGHLKFTVRQGAAVVDAIGFGLGDRAEMLRTGGNVDLAFALGEDNWGGTPKMQLRVKDVRLSNQ